MEKESKTCEQCHFVCKKNKICKNFKYGIKEYQVCFYDDFGDGVPICYDETFFNAKDEKSKAFALSYVGSPNIRVFVNYYGGTSKELVMIDFDNRESSYLDGTNSLNKNFKNYKQKHERILSSIKKRKKNF